MKLTGIDIYSSGRRGGWIGKRGLCLAWARLAPLREGAVGSYFDAGDSLRESFLLLIFYFHISNWRYKIRPHLETRNRILSMRAVTQLLQLSFSSS